MLPSARIDCPYCGESIEILIDDSAGDQRYIEDCQVCCRPIAVTVSSEQGDWRLQVATQDEV